MAVHNDEGQENTMAKGRAQKLCAARKKPSEKPRAVSQSTAQSQKAQGSLKTP